MIHAETIKESKLKTETTSWNYAWELHEKQESIFPFNLSPENAQEIISIACDIWKDILFDKWGKNIILRRDSVITEEEYNDMYKACNTNQKKLFDKIFKE